MKIIKTISSILFTILLLLVLTDSGFAQKVSLKQLRKWTSEAGKSLASYYASLKSASIFIKRRSDGHSVPQLYTGGHYRRCCWAFTFGKLNDDGVYAISYLIFLGRNNKVVRFSHSDTLSKASNYELRATQALITVGKDFKKEKGFKAKKYRIGVLQFPGYKFTAFVSPAQIRPNMVIFGNSIMYSLNSQGSKITNKTRFHHKVFRVPRHRPSNATFALMIPDEPLPSPIDVVAAIELKSPMLVLTENGVFRINPNGTIDKLPNDNPKAKHLSTQ